jgi:plasmid stability protein
MPDLIVHNVHAAIVAALQARADTENTSVEIEHLKILHNVLSKPAKKSFAEALLSIPSAGIDTDFDRIQ